MISLRYHVISIAAVFLALALGVVLGSTAISDRLLSGLSSNRDQLGRQVSDLQAERDGLRARLSAADIFGTAVGPRAVSGALRGRTVVLVTTADADPADRDALTALLSSAGATVTGELQLTDAFTDPSRSDQLSELCTRLLPAGLRLPTASDAGTLAGGLLGSLLLISPHNGKAQATPAETTAVLAGLGDGGFVRSGPQLTAAQLAVVLTDGAGRANSSADRAGILARFATQLDRAGAGAVLAGRPGSAEGNGPIGVVRADTAAASVLSTVDDVSTAAGRVATVLALAEQAQGRAGRYGTGGNAQAVVPALQG
ncbi:MAG: copper transporter [Pseudonocardiales bacterium]|nr:copper transporter [Pseudonocardiales bacterium]MBV9030613.1 copper transporter [Pseudonocardiales bacterium]MBW0009572.1 copper transporter [Pseudonocardiales bacterium]